MKNKYEVEDLRYDWTTEQLDVKFHDLYDASIFTWEGMSADEKNLEAICDELKLVNPSFIIWNGKQMNTCYGLTGMNAYIDDLTFVAIEHYYDPIAKLRYGARWFDDIVDNNMRRQNGYE